MKLIYSLSIFFTFSLTLFSQSLDDEMFKVLLSDANKVLLTGQNDSAKVLLLSALNKKPGSAICNYNLAQIYKSDNDNYLALDYAIKAVELSPDNYWYNLLLFELYQNTSQFNEAYSCLLTLKSLSNTRSTQILEINYYNTVGQKSKLLNSIENYTKNYGIDYLYVELYYESCYDFSDTIVFINFFKNYIENNSISNELFNLTFDYLIKFDQLALASNYISKLSTDNYYYKFFIYSEQNKVNLAFNAFYDYIYNFDNNINFRNNVDLKLTYILSNFSYPKLDSINVLLKTKRFNSNYTLLFHAKFNKKIYRLYDAAYYYNTLISKNPVNFEYFTDYMNILNKLNDWEQLDSITDVALTLFPAQPYSYLFKSISLLYLENYDDAKFYLNLTKTYSYGDSVLLSYTNFYNSEIARLNNNQLERKEYYQSAIKYASNMNLELFYAYIYLSNNVFLDDVNTTLNKYSSNNLYVLYLNIFYLYRINDYTKAINMSNNLLSNTKIPNFYYYELIGNIYLKLGNITKAEENWQLSEYYGNKNLNKNL